MNKENVTINKVFNAIPEVVANYPDSRWMFLTLTWGRHSITELNKSIETGKTAFDELSKSEFFKDVQGWIRCMEVACPPNHRDQALPHFHTMLLVKPEFFQENRGDAQWKTEWNQLTKKNDIRAAHITPIEVRKYRNKQDPIAVQESVIDVFKYSIKSPKSWDYFYWLSDLRDQGIKVRDVTTGGVLSQPDRDNYFQRVQLAA